MVHVSLLVRLEAKPGKEAELEAFLKGALPLANQETADLPGRRRSPRPRTQPFREAQGPPALPHAVVGSSVRSRLASLDPLDISGEYSHRFGLEHYLSEFLHLRTGIPLPAPSASKL
jgi:hypothetical protein